MHISLSQRRSLDLPSSLFTESGRLIPDFSVARRLAPRLNTSAARIYALSLINEAFSLILDYFDRTGLLPISTHLFHLESRLGRENLRTTLLRFVELFPPLRFLMEKRPRFNIWIVLKHPPKCTKR